MYLFFLWEVTYFKNCFMIKKRSNQLLKMSTLIWFLFPSSQLLRLSQERPTSPSHTLPQLQPPASTPDGQPQNLADVRRSLSPCHRTQLCIQDIQSCSSQTYSISPGFEPAGLTGHQLQTWSPDLPKGSAPSLARLRCTSDPGNATAPRWSCVPTGLKRLYTWSFFFFIIQHSEQLRWSYQRATVKGKTHSTELVLH